MRADDAALDGACPCRRRHVRGGLVRGGIGRPSPVHLRGAARGRRRPPHPPQGVPAHLRPVRRAAFLRRGLGDARHGQRPRSPAGHLGMRGLLAPGDAPAADARRCPGAHQRVLVPRAGRRRGQPGGPRHGDLVADAQPDVCPADDELRHLRQSSGCRRVDQLLGRVRGRRPVRRDRLPGAAPRGGSVHRDHRSAESCAGSASAPRCCGTSVQRWCCDSSTASPGRVPATPRTTGERRDRGRHGHERAGVRAAAGAGHRHSRAPDGSSSASSVPSSSRPASRSWSWGSRAASTRRSWRTSRPRPSVPPTCCA